MAKTWTLTLEPDRYGREQVRTISLTIDDISVFKDRAVFPWLLMAANPNLSQRDTQAVLSAVGEQHDRPVGWISRRRWMIHGKGKSGARRNVDGLDEKARTIMEENPRLSNRQMVHLLRENGVPRSREWVRRNRVAGN